MIEPSFKIYFQPGVFVFIDHHGSKVPYKIIDVDDSAHFVVAFEDVSSKDDSDRLSGLDVWIPMASVKSRHQRSPRNVNAHWEEYQIEDSDSKARYAIQRVEDFPQQLMAIIQINEKEIMIPLSDQLIQDIDKIEKIIRMEIPEGLLEL